MRTVTSGDVEYFYFYLKEINPINGKEESSDISSATSITFKMKRYGSKTVEISTDCSILNATLGICFTRVTIPTVESNTQNRYESELVVHSSTERKTWYNDMYFVIRPRL